MVAAQLHGGTLAVAVCIMYVIESRRPFWKTKAAAVFLLGGALVQFWWPGVALCVGAWLYIKQPTWRALLLWLAGTAGLTVINGNGWACASFAVLAVMAYGVTIAIPRASRFFYVYYPAHLATLLLLGFSLPSHP